MKVSLFFVASCVNVLCAASDDGEPEVETQKYQIRSKIQLKPVEDVEDLDEVKNDIENDIQYLFCEDPRLSIAEAQECELVNADYDNAVTDDSGLNGDVQFLVQISVPQTWTKNDLKGHYDEEVKQLSTTISTTTTVSTTNGDENSGTTTTTPAFTAESTTEAEITTEPAIETTTTKAVMETTTAATTTIISTTTDGENSGDASGEASGEASSDQFMWIESFMELGLTLSVGEEDAHSYNFIDVSTLNPDSFVVCVGDCKKEGFWMTIGFVSLSCLCLFLSGISFLCSNRGRYAMAAANSALLLGYIGGLIYVGVTEKVSWSFTGGYLAGTGLVLAIVLALGCMRVKTKKVKQDDVEMYWRNLTERDRQSKKHANHNF